MKRLRPFIMTESDLKKTSKWSRPAITATIKPFDNPDLDWTLRDLTLEAKKEVWIIGPYSEQEVTFTLGDHWITICRRTNWKVRMLDSCQTPGLSDALLTTEKNDLTSFVFMLNL